jgi:TRAP-type C4-dicarboxylate transport system substrate-binding protein
MVKIFKIFKKSTKDFKYSDLSSREQKRIIKQSIQEANKEQLELVEKFEKEFKNKGVKQSLS